MKSKSTKAKEISQETKLLVLERQHNLSISKVWLGRGVEFHHVIPRSAGGLGIPKNIVAITPQEHREFHDGKPITVNGKPYYTNEEFGILMKNHLKIRYPEWTESMCKYKKGKR